MALLIPVVVQAEKLGKRSACSNDEGDPHLVGSERIEPVHFKTVVGRGRLGFEISFREEEEAGRFQDRFASLLT